MLRLWAWAFLGMGTGSEKCGDKGLAHAWVLPQYSSAIQSASASEPREMERTPTYHDTEVAYLLKKLPWAFSRAQLSESTNCRKAQKANTKKSVPKKSVRGLVLDKVEQW